MKLNPTFKTPHLSNYELLDIGDAQKLEQFGEVILVRPEVSAKSLRKTIKKWTNRAHAEFIQKGSNKGEWKTYKAIDGPWEIELHGFKMELELYPFKHVGVFPEQVVNWNKIDEHLNKESRFLNLFAYTGASSIVGAKTGAKVIHVDSSKSIISQAKRNAEINTIQSISWVHEDALKFMTKEVKRGRKYDLVQMDPPAFGIAPGGKKWTLKKQLPELIKLSSQLLNRGGLLILNTYSPTIAKQDILQEAKKHFKKTECDLLWSKSETEKFLVHGHLLHAIR